MRHLIVKSVLLVGKESAKSIKLIIVF